MRSGADQSSSSCSANILVVIPSYGREDLLLDLLSDLTKEGLTKSDTLVVDNLGTFRPRVCTALPFRPRQNMRWLGSVNLGFRVAVAMRKEYVLALNTDVRLSHGLVAALRQHLEARSNVGLVAPCYDDYWPHQRLSTPSVRAADFVPGHQTRPVPFCDGTALMLRVDLIRVIGYLDSAAFPLHGYGADIDYCIRARNAGFKVEVTEAAYVNHLRRASMEVASQSEELALAETEFGMASKYGSDWRALVGLSQQTLRSVRVGSPD